MARTCANPGAGNAGARKIISGNGWSFTNSQVSRPNQVSGSNTCTAAGLTVRSNAPALALCRHLLAAGLDPDRALSIFAWIERRIAERDRAS